jgi:hypothetical protein
MKTLSFFVLTLISITASAQSSPVIVELFTSQGCSSCPSADKNLAEIVENAERNHEPVYGLSFHVDYWNHLGWKDPYSNRAFTERQRNYAKLMNSESIYTPQIVINGENEFVGSNVKSIRGTIAAELASKKIHSLRLMVI